MSALSVGGDTATPRTSSMSPRVTGCRYAMMASVSSTAREYRGGFSLEMRSMNPWYSGFTRKRHPDATLVSSIERSAHSALSASRTLRMLSASTSPAKRRFSCCTDKGSEAERSAASSTRFTSSRSMECEESGFVWSFISGDCQCGALGPELHVDRIEGRLLRELHERFARELEEGEEGHHQERHAAVRIEELGELDVASAGERVHDPAHVRANGKLLARDLVVRGHARAREDRAPRLREVGHAHVGRPLGERLLDVHLDQGKISARDRDLGDREGGLLHALVLEEAAHELRARVLGLRGVLPRARQEHARLDLDENAG